MLALWKKQKKHGEWLPWLAENCPDISERTAQDYMWANKKSEEIDKACEAKTQHASDLSIRGAKKLLAKPLTAEKKAERKKAKALRDAKLVETEQIIASRGSSVPIEEHLKALDIDEIVKALLDAFTLEQLGEINNRLHGYVIKHQQKLAA
jgi:hypothetical protein